MIIGIFGATQSAHFLAQNLDKNNKVTKVYHYQTSTHNKFSKNLKKYEAVTKGDMSYTIKTVMSCDLLITMGLVAQLDKQLQSLISRTQAIKLVPSYECSLLEDSKIVSKQIFKELGIRTADYFVVEYSELLDNFYNYARPFVLKFDQDFRAGRQTLIVRNDNCDEIYNEIKTQGKTKFKSTEENKNFIIEQYLAGNEHSLHVLCKGLDWCYLGSARDYKKELDGDRGNNVTSMGCYSPAGSISDDVASYIDRLLKYLHDRNTPYYGIMYLGILRDSDQKDHVLEINSRPGNPEFITILDNLDEDILDIFTSNNLGKRQIKLKDSVSLNIQLHEDRSIYDKPLQQEVILNNEPESIIASYSTFFGLMPPAGLTTSATTLEDAAECLYRYLDSQNLNLKYRKDIGKLL
jgi:phosphoribosylamine--glycine ligase